MSREENEEDLRQTEELFEFLQGVVPDGYKIGKKRTPKLTPDQAWTVVWYLGNLYWKPTDRVERCDVCGDLYHSWNAGRCLDYGKAPYHFCDNCMDTDDYARKASRDPDRSPQPLPEEK